MNTENCFQYCKLCSWSGAAREYAKLNHDDRIRLIARLAQSERGDWYVDNLIAAIGIATQTPEYDESDSTPPIIDYVEHWLTNASYEQIQRAAKTFDPNCTKGFEEFLILEKVNTAEDLKKLQAIS